MKIAAALLVCLLLSFTAFAQRSETENARETAVEEITLFRDDGAGKMGDEAEVFSTGDIPIHCSVQLDSIEPASIKMNLVAVKAAGIKSGSAIVSVNYKTNGSQNQVNFTASPAGVWAVGRYRVDIFVNGKLSKSREFDVIEAK